MNEKVKKYLKLGVVVVIVVGFVWWLVISPYVIFRNNENALKDAAIRYYELNSDKLPAIDQISTVTLSTLGEKSYVTEDFYIPLSNKTCSPNSWVKVKNTKNGYKYYPYLECGHFKSSVDHNGPRIVLNGSDEITISVGEKYKEAGVKKIIDNNDGYISTKTVKIDNKELDNEHPGIYNIYYTAYDSFRNKSQVVRKVRVVNELKSLVKKETKNGYYVGNLNNNYILFSNVLYRIIGLDGDNIRMVSQRDISNVDYDGIKEWKNYYYDHIDDDSKRILVKSKSCMDTISNEEFVGYKECKKTEDEFIALIGLDDIRKTSDKDGKSFIIDNSINWLNNSINKKEAWVFREYFMETGTQFMNFSREYNFGMRPVITIKGDVLLESGDGSFNNPYVIEGTKPAPTDTYVNELGSGAYLKQGKNIWRVIESLNDGTTKVISVDEVRLRNTDAISYEGNNAVNIYNPTKKGNVGYIINQKVSESIDVDNFVKHEIKVPIYDKVSMYGKEQSNKKYKVKFHAPNMYDLFTTPEGNFPRGYWLMNSCKTENMKYYVSPYGTVDYGFSNNNAAYGVRVVGYLNKNVRVVSGNGTIDKPYKITH